MQHVKTVSVLLATCLMAGASESLAQDDVVEKAAKKTAAEELADIAESRYAGFGFGVALSATVDLGSRDRIKDADVDPNGIVRVNEDTNTRTNFMLETHYFFTPSVRILEEITRDEKARVNENAKLISIQDSEKAPSSVPAKEIRCSDTIACEYFGLAPGDWGVGPFVAVQPGSDDIIEAVGAGLMVGFKRSAIVARERGANQGDSFNLGVGIMLDPNEKVLGDGIEKNQPLPQGETAIRFKETTQTALVFLFSYSF